ncbi:MAG: (2Fe-2S)-binding protein [Caldithrix sp.]|nr:MAG: (2Fe-2S)-binding protein [Caldithrix sp.]
MSNLLQTVSTFALKVNGEVRTVEASPDMPLLWVLRDLMRLTGTKYGCGIGLCGACTIHLDGEAIRSCSTPISAAVGKEVTTIEGLSIDGTHPLQLAWDELNVSQCGYCQTGQIMTAASWMREKENPTPQAIDGYQSGNLCRCGTYTRIRAAIVRATEIEGR